MVVFHLLSWFVALSSCTLSSLQACQGALTDTSREKVPGSNPSYYTRVKQSDQIFDITEFIVSPTPPLTHNTNRVFFYLSGDITRDYPGLENATLTIFSTFQGDEYEFTEKLSDFELVTVRRDGVYGGPLTIGGNELVGDQEIMHWGKGESEQVYIEVVARLLDGRVLFAFDADVEVRI